MSWNTLPLEIKRLVFQQLCKGYVRKVSSYCLVNHEWFREMTALIFPRMIIYPMLRRWSRGIITIDRLNTVYACHVRSLDLGCNASMGITSSDLDILSQALEAGLELAATHLVIDDVRGLDRLNLPLTKVDILNNSVEVDWFIQRHAPVDVNLTLQSDCCSEIVKPYVKQLALRSVPNSCQYPAVESLTFELIGEDLEMRFDMESCDCPNLKSLSLYPQMDIVSPSKFAQLINQNIEELDITCNTSNMNKVVAELAKLELPRLRFFGIGTREDEFDHDMAEFLTELEKFKGITELQIVGLEVDSELYERFRRALSRFSDATSLTLYLKWTDKQELCLKAIGLAMPKLRHLSIRLEEMTVNHVDSRVLFPHVTRLDTSQWDGNFNYSYHFPLM